MKTLIAAIAICALVIGTTVFGAVFTEKKLSSFADDIESAFPDNTGAVYDAEEGARKIEDEYKRIKKYLFFFIHDDEVREIEEHVADIKSAVSANEQSNLISAKNRLKLHIEQLRRLSKFSIESIL